MAKCMTTWTTIALMFLTCSCLADQGRKPGASERESLELPPDIYVTRLSERILQLKVRGPLGTNIVVVATEKGLVVVDTYAAPCIFEQVTKIVEKEFDRRDYAYVINSHRDVDHSGGNGYFEDVVMVGHEKMLRQLMERHADRERWEAWYRGRIQGWMRGRQEKLATLDKASPEAGELMADVRLLKEVDGDFARGFPVVPDHPRANITFTDRLTLELGDVTIECYDCPAGHTPGDILIYIPAEEFLFTGDAAQLYIQKDVDMKAWLKQLACFSQPDMPVKMVLGGHDAKPGTKEELRNLHDYFQATWDCVRQAHEDGLSLEQIKQECSVDTKLSRFHTIFNLPELAEIHEYNVESIVQRLTP